MDPGSNMSALNPVDQTANPKNDGSLAFEPLIDDVIAARRASEQNADIYAWLDHLHENREQSKTLFLYCCPVEGCSNGHVTFSDAAALDGHMQAYHPTWEPTKMRQQEKLSPYRWDSKVAGEGPADFDHMKSDRCTDDFSCNTTASFSADENYVPRRGKTPVFALEEYDSCSTVGVPDSCLIEGGNSSAKPSSFRMTPVIHTIHLVSKSLGTPQNI